MKRILGLILAVSVAGVLAVAGQAGNSPRSGALHVTKECSQYTGQAGSFCTITSSSLRGIDVGSDVIYAQAAGAAGLDSDLVLDTGPGNSAFGHVTLSFATLSGVVTFSRGAGQFRGFQARVIVTYNPDTKLWHWDGTYSFNPPGAS
ncbi:MAG: hypothetical protein HOQ28_20165 [Thermoleophilia bacterium]|nr:hypothetical protein [Thermoleophilia bacterium]